MVALNRTYTTPDDSVNFRSVFSTFEIGRLPVPTASGLMVICPCVGFVSAMPAFPTVVSVNSTEPDALLTCMVAVAPVRLIGVPALSSTVTVNAVVRLRYHSNATYGGLSDSNCASVVAIVFISYASQCPASVRLLFPSPFRVPPRPNRL